MSQDPYTPPGQYPIQSGKQSVAAPLIEASFWLKLLGISLILNGVIACISIIGIIVGWLPIWIGILFWQAASAYDAAKNSGDPRHEFEGHSKLGLALKIQGILVLIGLVFFALYIAFIISMIIFGFTAGGLMR